VLAPAVSSAGRIDGLDGGAGRTGCTNSPAAGPGARISASTRVVDQPARRARRRPSASAPPPWRSFGAPRKGPRRGLGDAHRAVRESRRVVSGPQRARCSRGRAHRSRLRSVRHPPAAAASERRLDEQLLAGRRGCPAWPRGHAGAQVRHRRHGKEARTSRAKWLRAVSGDGRNVDRPAFRERVDELGVRTTFVAARTATASRTGMPSRRSEREGEPAQRRDVRPVRVVNGEQHGAAPPPPGSRAAQYRPWRRGKRRVAGHVSRSGRAPPPTTGSASAAAAPRRSWPGRQPGSFGGRPLTDGGPRPEAEAPVRAPTPRRAKHGRGRLGPPNVLRAPSSVLLPMPARARHEDRGPFPGGGAGPTPSFRARNSPVALEGARAPLFPTWLADRRHPPPGSLP